MSRAPLIVGLGGTLRPASVSERVMLHCLRTAGALGCETRALAARDLRVPMYAPHGRRRSAAAIALVEALRAADGLVIVSPGYHGGMSGMVKNALDYAEDLRADARPYLEGRAVGLVSCAAGWQATATTLMAMRSVVHALRGWPTPLGVTLNSARPEHRDDALPHDSAAQAQLDLMVAQVVAFARRPPSGA